MTGGILGGPVEMADARSTDEPILEEERLEVLGRRNHVVLVARGGEHDVSRPDPVLDASVTMVARPLKTSQ